MKLKQGEKYEVWWLDTFSYSGWYTTDDVLDKAKKNKANMHSIGWYVTEKHGFVIISMTKNPVSDFSPWGAPKWIPRGCIKRIKRL